jgi:MFS family permease
LHPGIRLHSGCAIFIAIYGLLLGHRMVEKEGKFKSGFRGVPPQVKAIIWLTSFTGLGVGYLMTYTAAYLPEIGISSSDVGLIIGSMSVAAMVAAVPLGLLSDRIGRKKVLLFALAIFPFIVFGFAFTTELWALLVLAVMAGISEGAFLTAWNALIADQTTLENRNPAFALSFIISASATGIGMAMPFFFPYIEEIIGWGPQAVHSMAFIVIGLVCAISPIGVFFELRGYHEMTIKKSEKHPTLHGRTKRNLLRFSLINALIGLGAGFIISLIPTWLFLRYDVPDSYSGPLLAVASITMAFASLASARLAFRYGPVKAITLTQGLSTIFLVMIPLVPGAALASITYVIRSMFMNMSAPIADSYLMGIISKEDRGVASAINNIIWRLPNSITTIFGGMLLAAGFYDLPFYITTICYVTAITSFYLLFKNVKPEA